MRSIALSEDNISHQSCEDGGTTMDVNYLSDGTSRRSSLADTMLVLSQNMHENDSIPLSTTDAAISVSFEIIVLDAVRVKF